MECGTDQDQSYDGNDSHEDTRAFSQGHSVDLDKWLRCLQCEQDIEVGGAKEEENGGYEAQDPSCECAR